MKIQKATEQDIPLIQNLAEKSWKANYPGIISNEQIDYMLNLMYSEKEILSHFRNPNYNYYLIGDGDDFYGIIGFEHLVEANTTKLHRLYLLAESKGKGFGKAAMDFLKNEVKKFGDTRIILNVNKKNTAYHFYLSQNFKIYDDIELQIGNGYVMDDYLMEFVI